MITASLWNPVGWFFSDVDGVFLTVLRVAIFSLPLYMLLSRYYGHLGSLPESALGVLYSGRRLSSLTVLSPTRIPFRAVYAVAILACLSGLLGLLPAASSLVASLAIVVLNNYYAAVSTSDLEVLPYVVGLFIFAVLRPDATIPLWVELGGQSPPPAPSFPFRLLQMYFAAVFFTNGIIKVPFWREWILEKGVYYDADNWNNLSPALDTHWDVVVDKRDVPYLWEALGVLTISIELAAVFPLVYPPTLLVVWPAMVGFFVGNHLLRSTSFLLLPWLYLASYLPWFLRVFT